MNLGTRIAAGVGLSIFATLAAAYLARDALITRYVADQLEQDPHTRCAPIRFSVSASLQRLTAHAPIDCRMDRGPITRVRTDDDIVATLHGTTLRNVHVGRARLDQRERRIDAHCNLLGEAANIVGVSDGLLKGLVDAAENYELTEHVTHIKRLDAYRGGKPESKLDDVEGETVDGWNVTRARRARVPGPQLYTVTELVMRVRRDVGTITARVHPGEKSDDKSALLGVRMKAQGLSKPAQRCELALTAPD